MDENDARMMNVPQSPFPPLLMCWKEIRYCWRKINIPNQQVILIAIR
uniref:Uncharacterized protein n=1 Tax=Triticum urartu TaxID=4572 RepID=A0A8R7TJS9_TRIUA